MVRAAVRWLALATLVCSGCWWEDPSCDPPDEVEYDCQPIPDGSAGCKGGPMYYEGDHLIQVDPNKTFPFGCHATLPRCDTFHGGVQVGTCEQYDATTTDWLVPG